MKISVSLPDEDVQFERALMTEYELASREWSGSEDAALWENTSRDGLS